ncbi:MAG: hypothetical protein HC923_04080, partial [Myxococcales bacterium]|nr:hypothetical protein [Myxococcales bacterium]
MDPESQSLTFHRLRCVRFARHRRDALPHASFIGFTGTPIEKSDANTQAV